MSRRSARHRALPAIAPPARGAGSTLAPFRRRRGKGKCHVVFRGKPNHRAPADPAQEEPARVNALSPADLAGEVMAAFGPQGPRAGGDVTQDHIATWLFRAYPRASRYATAARLAASEAFQVLEHAELIRLDKAWSAPNYWTATRLGWEAIETAAPDR